MDGEITHEADRHVTDRLPERKIHMGAERLQQRPRVIRNPDRQRWIVADAFAGSHTASWSAGSARGGLSFAIARVSRHVIRWVECATGDGAQQRPVLRLSGRICARDAVLAPSGAVALAGIQAQIRARGRRIPTATSRRPTRPGGGFLRYNQPSRPRAAGANRGRVETYHSDNLADRDKR